ncbi:hypothetical protein G4B88_003456 [Cannabis sativa]|uniref:Uncharacterized protein n=1 Tax=Cannabis sativa TaxID=3483 RepID=A0A7J6GVX0_CANSA|nr:hypothetical protein G4B88_003456 [Cannabis sativa]
MEGKTRVIVCVLLVSLVLGQIQVEAKNTSEVVKEAIEKYTKAGFAICTKGSITATPIEIPMKEERRRCLRSKRCTPPALLGNRPAAKEKKVRLKRPTETSSWFTGKSQKISEMRTATVKMRERKSEEVPPAN